MPDIAPTYAVILIICVLYILTRHTVLRSTAIVDEDNENDTTHQPVTELWTNWLEMCSLPPGKIVKIFKIYFLFFFFLKI